MPLSWSTEEKQADESRNPWGKGKKGIWEGAWSDGSKEFTPEAQQELNHKFGNDSVFWISYPDLLRKYQHFDRTRLFMDSPDWRITQKWISVEVPWKAEFEQKFRIVLKKKSPVVLVLSQLDDRYFDGLQGQYSFRLQFRLHEVDSPGEEDYIVRSHGNYLMERSVVTELKSLKAGTYSVFIMVVADRDASAPSAEDVVKAQCRRKTDNDKLAQVGTAYDLAHSKGAQYMESQAAIRRAKEKAKAREVRAATRRKNWEKRHLGLEIMRKQGRKNHEKRKLKEAKDEAEEKEEEEREPKDRGMQTEDIKKVTAEKEDKGVQTEDPTPEPEKVNTQPINENDKAVQVEMQDFSGSTTSSQDTPSTPNSSRSSQSPVRIVLGPPPPPPPGAFYPSQRKGDPASQPRYSQQPSQRIQVQTYITSDGESSASPVEEYDDLYNSDDDQILKARQTTGDGAKSGGKKGSDDEEDIEPWNAVCIVSFRVYSKDEGLEVEVYGEEGNEGREVGKGLGKGEEEAGTDADDEDGEVKSSKELSAKEVKDSEDVQKEVESASKAKTDKTALPVPAKERDDLVAEGEKKTTSSSDSPTSSDDNLTATDTAVTQTKVDAPKASESIETLTT